MRKNSKTAAKHEMLRQLHEQYHKGRGNSKREAKAKGGGVSPAIHSRTTLQSYCQQVSQYGNWLAQHHPGATLDGAALHTQEYIDGLRAEGASAWTQQLARSAIGKALGREPTTLAKTDTRHAADIKRGRTETSHAAAAAAKWSADLSICECMGVRHGKEACQVTPAACHWSDGHITSVSLVGKGGRPREATVLAGKGRDILESRCKAAQAAGQMSKPLLGSMTGANVHRARARYAAGCYAKALAEGRGTGQMYHPKELKRAYDKGALDYVNAQLGHGAGRYDVAVYNYLSYGSVTK